MSNLKSAAAAIEAEIAYARSGLDYYTSRVETLEQALANLQAIGETEDKSLPAPAQKTGHKLKRGPRAKQAKAVEPKLNKKEKKERKGANDLPSTGGEYWPNLVTDQPQHSSAILEAAIGKLGFAPSKDQVKKLTQRMTFALNSLVKSNKIQNSGSGRDRVFFKAA